MTVGQTGGFYIRESVLPTDVYSGVINPHGRLASVFWQRLLFLCDFHIFIQIIFIPYFTLSCNELRYAGT